MLKLDRWSVPQGGVGAFCITYLLNKVADAALHFGKVLVLEQIRFLVFQPLTEPA
jgi:hypothetical protein